MKKNGNKLFIILTVIFALSTLLLAAFIVLDLGKSKKDTNNVKSETNDNMSEVYLDYFDAGENTKIYSVFDHFIVFSVNKELYLVNYFSPMWFSSSIYLVDDLTFDNNVAHVKEADLEANVFKLGINTDNIYKVISRHSPYYNDPTGEVYILYKDKGLTYFTEHDLFNNFVATKSLTDYNNIISVDYKCEYGEFGCEKVSYNITTKDGKTTKLDKLLN